MSDVVAATKTTVVTETLNDAEVIVEAETVAAKGVAEDDTLVLREAEVNEAATDAVALGKRRAQALGSSPDVATRALELKSWTRALQSSGAAALGFATWILLTLIFMKTCTSAADLALVPAAERRRWTSTTSAFHLKPHRRRYASITWQWSACWT
jgi:hypothetical protein